MAGPAAACLTPVTFLPFSYGQREGSLSPLLPLWTREPRGWAWGCVHSHVGTRARVRGRGHWGAPDRAQRSPALLSELWNLELTLALPSTSSENLQRLEVITGGATWVPGPQQGYVPGELCGLLRGATITEQPQLRQAQGRPMSESPWVVAALVPAAFGAVPGGCRT